MPLSADGLPIAWIKTARDWAPFCSTSELQNQIQPNLPKIQSIKIEPTLELCYLIVKNQILASFLEISFAYLAVAFMKFSVMD